MIRARQARRAGRVATSLFLSGILSFTLTPVSVAAAMDKELFRLLNDCWTAVDENNADALSSYSIAFSRTETFQPDVINDVFVGIARTGIGEIDVNATVRDGVLFDCTLLTFPARDDSDPVHYADAEETLRAWFLSKLERDGHHDTLSDSRFFGIVRCNEGSETISASAMSMGPVEDMDAMAPGSTLPTPGELRFSVYSTHPRNFEMCRTIGTQGAEIHENTTGDGSSYPMELVAYLGVSHD